MPRAPDPYEKFKAKQADISRQRSAEGREVGPLPAVADPARRAAALGGGLLAFARTYFPARFPWPFAEPHEEAGGRIDRCSAAGGLFASAMPRGMGKTTLGEVAVIRNTVAGLRRFNLLLQATDKLAARSLKKIQREFECNDLLAADFPEVCHPIRRLERIHNRAKGQTLNGEPTRIEWTADGVTLPTVAGSAASGAVIYVAGITGAVRGLSVSAPDGSILRPDFVLIDDVQTRDSAKSPPQTADREAVILDDVLGLAGPGVEIAALMLCTVIYPGDLSDRFLDPERHPDWRGVRTRMLTAWPARMDLWDQYADVRRESIRAGDEGRRATAFYAENRDEMDRGAAVSWPARMKPGELSGVQSAMNLWYKNPRGFKAEYQNDPEPAGGVGTAKELTPTLVAGRLSGVERHMVPRDATRLTAFVDAGGGQGRGIWYAVVAWDDAFGGSVIDYGTWPRQARAVFAKDDMKPGLSDAYPGLEKTAMLYAGLTDLTNAVLGRTYFRDGAGEMRVERCLVDSGWESKTVQDACRASPHAATIFPSKGIGRTTTARGVAAWKARPGERSGYHWRLTAADAGRGRMVQFDPDMWKTFVYDRLTTPAASRGYLSLFGRSAAAHELVSEHCAAESAEPMTLHGATFDKWTQKPHRPDNDWFDCLVGAAVAASVQGLVWSAGAAAGQPDPPKAKKVKRDIEAEYAKARGIK